MLANGGWDLIQRLMGYYYIYSPLACETKLLGWGELFKDSCHKDGIALLVDE